MSWQLMQGNALSLPLPDESVDLIVTSPPYFALRSYQDGGEHVEGQLGSEATPADFLDALIAATREMVRVLKPTGSIFVNLGDKLAGSGGHNNDGISAKSTLRGNGHVGGFAKDGSETKIRATRRSAPDRYNQNSGGVRAKSLMGLPWRYAIRCIDELDLILRAEIIWHKGNGMPESVKDRVHRKHEQWFHLTKNGVYFESMKTIYTPHTYKANGAVFGGKKAVGAEGLLASSSRRMGANTYDDLNPAGKAPSSVWQINTEPLTVPDHLKTQHFAAFPSEWPRRLTLGWCPPDGTVLDPFVGTGTTVAAAHALGRQGVGIDLSADYLRLARWRITESGLVEKIRQRTYSPKVTRPRKVRVPAGEIPITLFDLLDGPPEGVTCRTLCL